MSEATDKVQAILKDIEIRFPMPIQISVHDEPPPEFSVSHGNGLPIVCMWYMAQDRDGGPPEWRAGDFCRIMIDEADCPSAVLSKVRRLVHTVVCHEIDESVYLRGKRIWDPHGDDQ